MSSNGNSLVWDFANTSPATHYFFPFDKFEVASPLTKTNSVISFNYSYMNSEYILDGVNPSKVKTVSDITDRMVDRILYAVYALEHEIDAHITNVSAGLKGGKGDNDHLLYGNDGMNPKEILNLDMFNEMVENFKNGDLDYIDPDSKAGRLILKLIELKETKKDLIKQTILDMINTNTQSTTEDKE